MTEKSTQTFIITKQQKKVLNWLWKTLTNSVLGIGENYYPPALLEECKYVAQEKRCLSTLLMEKILTKKILMKKILMNKAKYRVRLVFIFFDASKKRIMFKVTQMILSLLS